MKLVVFGTYVDLESDMFGGRCMTCSTTGASCMCLREDGRQQVGTSQV